VLHVGTRWRAGVEGRRRAYRVGGGRRARWKTIATRAIGVDRAGGAVVTVRRARRETARALDDGAVPASVAVEGTLRDRGARRRTERMALRIHAIRSARARQRGRGRPLKGRASAEHVAVVVEFAALHLRRGRALHRAHRRTPVRMATKQGRQGHARPGGCHEPQLIHDVNQSSIGRFDGAASVVAQR